MSDVNGNGSPTAPAAGFGLGGYSSPTLGALAAALSAAQGMFGKIERTREVTVRMRAEKGGGSYTFKYAPLDEVLAATRPALAANGLAVSQIIAGDKLTTTLLHKSGEWLASSLPLPPRPALLQDLGSQLTYLRRYAYASLLGVAPEEDDDGNHGDGNPFTERERPREREPQGGPTPAPAALDHVRTKKPPKAKAAARWSGSAEIATGKAEELDVLVDKVEPGESPSKRKLWTATLTKEDGNQIVVVTFDPATGAAVLELEGSSALATVAQKSLGDKTWIGLESIASNEQPEDAGAEASRDRSDIPF